VKTSYFNQKGKIELKSLAVNVGL